MRNTIILVFASFVVSQWTVHAQPVDFPKISPNDFNTTASAVIDSNTHAVVLWEKGHSEIVVHEEVRGLRVIHRYGVRIKILDKEGFKNANYTIPLRKIGPHFEFAHQVEGYTHTYDSQIQTVAMGRDAVFNEELNEYMNLVRFTLPNISEGVIVDIFYEIVSPDIFNFRKWHYQTDIPKVHSEYTAIIPALFEYNVTLKGGRTLDDVNTSLLREHFLAGGRRYDCSKLVYTMTDIPAFREEMYMLAPVNYMAAINFELIQYHLPTGGKEVFTKEWKNVDRELLGDKSFGKQLERTRDFESVLNTIEPSDSDLTKAKKAFAYVQNQIRWNKTYGKYAQHGVKEALIQRHGNIGDINLTLIACLRVVGLDAYPVVLSTRENGLPNSLHPVLSDFNYVVAHVNVAGQDYFLDASEQNLPFGLLPLRCINGNGRIIYSKKASEWITLENHIESQTSYTISGSLDSVGQFTGMLTVSHRGLNALNQRNHIRSFPTIDEYIEDRMDRVTAIRIQDGQVHSLDSLEQPLRERYEIQMDFSAQLQNGKFNLNPVFINRTTTNPFNLEERNYHVDLGSRMRETLTVAIRLPEGYTLQNRPPNVSFALPEKSAIYSYESNYDLNLLQMRQTMALNKPIYEVDEYYHLKEFFSRIIQHQMVDFVFDEAHEL